MKRLIKLFKKKTEEEKLENKRLKRVRRICYNRIYIKEYIEFKKEFEKIKGFKISWKDRELNEYLEIREKEEIIKNFHQPMMWFTDSIHESYKISMY